MNEYQTDMRLLDGVIRLVLGVVWISTAGGVLWILIDAFIGQ